MDTGNDGSVSNKHKDKKEKAQGSKLRSGSNKTTKHISCAIWSSAPLATLGNLTCAPCHFAIHLNVSLSLSVSWI